MPVHALAPGWLYPLVERPVAALAHALERHEPQPIARARSLADVGARVARGEPQRMGTVQVQRQMAGVAPARHARPTGRRDPAVVAGRLLAALVVAVRGGSREQPAVALDAQLVALPVVEVEPRVGALATDDLAHQRRDAPAPELVGACPRAVGVGVVEPDSGGKTRHLEGPIPLCGSVAL